MPTGWTQVPLESLAVEGSVTYGVVQPGQAVADGVPMVRVNNFRGFGLDTSDVLRISADVEAKYARTRLRADDVLVTVVGTVGQVAVVPHWLAGWNVARAVAVIRPRDARLTRWIALALRAPESQRALGVAANTTVQTTINLKDLRKLPVPLPEPNEREAIELLLGSLDDRIDLLRQTNATLEAIAQALFKSWFIDFDPVRAKAEGRDPEGLDPATAALFPSDFEESPLGLIPKGWRCGCLGDVLTQRTSRAKASEFTATLPYVPIECITAKSIFLLESLPGEQAQSSLTLFKRGDILFGAMRPYFHKVCIAPFDGVTRTTAFVLRSEHPSFALFAMFDESTVEFATTHSEGSTIPYAKWAGSLERKPLVLPPTDLMSCFEAVATPIVDAGMQNTHRMRTLAELRDTLLPRLISGKLRLPEAEREIEDAIA